MTDDEKEFASDHRKILAAYEAFQAGRWGQAIEEIAEFLKYKHKANESEQQEWAMSFIRRRCRWFRDRLGEEALAKWKAGEFKDAGEYAEYLRDRASDLVSHVRDAQLYLTVSDNSDTVAEEGVQFWSNNHVDWCIAASYALAADAGDDLMNENVTGEPPQEPSKYCSQCDKWVPDCYWIVDDGICTPCAEASM